MPDRAEPLQRHGLCAPGRLGPHTLGRGLLQQRAGHQPGAPDAAQGGQPQSPPPGGKVVYHRIGRQITPDGDGGNDQGGHIPSQPCAHREPYHDHQEGMEQIIAHDFDIRVPQRLEGSDIRAGVLDQPVHGAHHHQHRAQEKEHRENVEYGRQVVPHLQQIVGLGIVLQ